MRYGPVPTDLPDVPLYVRVDVTGDWAQAFVDGRFACEGHASEILQVDELTARLTEKVGDRVDAIRLGDVFVDHSWKAVPLDDVTRR